MDNELIGQRFRPLNELDSIIKRLSTGKELKSVCMLELMDLLRDVNDKYSKGEICKQERYHSIRSILKFLLIGSSMQLSPLERIFNRIFNENRLSIKHRSNSWELVFYDIDFSGYIFSNISFPRNTQFIGCKFNKTEFEKLKTSKIYFRDCIFTDASFDNSSLGITSFKNCTLSNAIFSNTRLGVNNVNSAIFNNCEMNGLTFKKLKGSRISFQDCQMIKSKILNSNLASSKFENCVLQESVLSETAINGSELNSCNFNGSSFVDSSFKKAYFKACTIENINTFNSIKKMSFVGSSFTACSFNSSDLTSSDFRKTKLHACEFYDTNVKHALGL